jgi:phospholipid transport system substrate-binding protein
MRCRILTLVALLVLGGAAGAAEPVDEPVRVVQSTADTVLGTLRQQRVNLQAEPAKVYGLVDELLVPHVDFARLSSLVLGRHWRTASSDQRERFSREFKRLLVRTYATGLLELDTWEIHYPPQRVAADADDVVVRSELLRAGAQPVPVDYRMHRADGRWRVYDVSIDGVSFASTYRNSFDAEVRQVGIDGLINRLGELNAQRTGEVRPAG